MKEFSLAVCIPVYNEEACIEEVLLSWLKELKDRISGDFRILVFDDGSSDSSFQKIRGLAERHEEILAFHHENQGHGPTLLKAYAIGFGLAEWVLQIDSDNEINPKDFAAFWRLRETADFIIGKRNRNSPLIRQLITFISRQVIHFIYGNRIYDVNCPFRLMRSICFESHVKGIPAHTFAPNLLISGLAAKNRLRIAEVPITHVFRATGHVSIRKFKLAKVAVKSLAQTLSFALFK
ncbi:MAG: glycosyltransferase family 2 protein [Bacteroidota bacterium]